jgi:hypothetical protein
MNTQTYHRTAIVNGRKVFYRESGDPMASPFFGLISKTRDRRGWLAL